MPHNQTNKQTNKQKILKLKQYCNKFNKHTKNGPRQKKTQTNNKKKLILMKIRKKKVDISEKDLQS